MYIFLNHQLDESIYIYQVVGIVLRKISVCMLVMMYVFVSISLPILGNDTTVVEAPIQDEPDQESTSQDEIEDVVIDIPAEDQTEEQDSLLELSSEENEQVETEEDEEKEEDNEIESVDSVQEQEEQEFSNSQTSAAGVTVSVFAQAGVLPIGTTMRLQDVSVSQAEDVASSALSEEIESAQGVDISFYNAQGTEIEPNGYVSVSIQLPSGLEGDNFQLIHVCDSGTTENMGAATSTGASFASNEFSLYVLAGTGSKESPLSNVYREYTIGYGESVTILSDERNHDGEWIPGNGNPSWNVTDVSGGNVDQLATFQRYRGTAYVQPRLVVSAKNKTGTIRVAFRYTHPEDKTHKTFKAPPSLVMGELSNLANYSFTTVGACIARPLIGSIYFL